MGGLGRLPNRFAKKLAPRTRATSRDLRGNELFAAELNAVHTRSDTYAWLVNVYKAMWAAAGSTSPTA
jgi:hypothetical protein